MPTKKELEARAKELKLELEAKDKANKDALAAAIIAAKDDDDVALAHIAEASADAQPEQTPPAGDTQTPPAPTPDPPTPADSRTLSDPAADRAAADVGLEEAQEKAEQEVADGFVGTKVDPYPNTAYSQESDPTTSPSALEGTLAAKVVDVTGQAEARGGQEDDD